MSGFRFSFSRHTKKAVAVRLIASIGFAAALAASGTVAHSAGRHEPISVGCAPPTFPPDGNQGGLHVQKKPAANVSLGGHGGVGTMPITITLDGGPENITVYSSPAGAVAYQGGVSDATATVTAAVDPDAQGTVTVYAITDGETVVSSQVDLTH